MADQSVGTEMKGAKTELVKMFKKWVKAMDMLGEWHIDVDFVWGSALPEQGLHSTTFASCRVMWEYKRATVTFYLEEVINTPYGEWERNVVHELLHIPLAEIQRAAEDNASDLQMHVERATTSLTRIVAWVAYYASKGKITPP